MRYHYLPYTGDQYKYLYLLGLSSVAAYNRQTRRYDTIVYTSLDALAAQINEKAGTPIVSKATLSRFLDKEARTFFTCDKKQKTIVLHNNYAASSQKQQQQPFVMLTTK